MPKSASFVSVTRRGPLPTPCLVRHERPTSVIHRAVGKTSIAGPDASTLAAAAAWTGGTVPVRQRGILFPRRPPSAARQQRHRQVKGAVIDAALPVRRAAQIFAHRTRRRHRKEEVLD